MIFASSDKNNFWLATRCINTWSNYNCYSAQKTHNGTITSQFAMCNSWGANTFGASEYFRVVNSVPGNRINIADDGSITLKAKNS